MLDTGIRTSELMAIRNEDYNPESQSILIRPDVAKTSRSRTLYLSAMTNTSLKKFLKVKPKEWEKWLFPTRDGKQLQANVLGRNFRKYCDRTGVKFTPIKSDTVLLPFIWKTAAICLPCSGKWGTQICR